MIHLPPLLGISPGFGGAVQIQVEAAVRGGLAGLILREPQLDERSFVTLARALSPLFEHPAHEPEGALILHAKQTCALEVAVAAGWGLHCPEGADLAAARSVVRGPLGASCHDLAGLEAAAAAGCDYALLSPVFSPRSKPEDRRQSLGLAAFADLVARAGLPVYALGGVTPARVPELRAAGAAGLAVLGALFAPDASPEATESEAADLCQAWARAIPRKRADSGPHRA